MTDIEDLDFGAEFNRINNSTPATAGEFLRVARISSTSLEGFWAEVAWEVSQRSLAGPPRLAKKGSLAKEVHALIKAGKGMAGIGEAADTLLQAWRDAGGTPMDLNAAIKRWRG